MLRLIQEVLLTFVGVAFDNMFFCFKIARLLGARFQACRLGVLCWPAHDEMCLIWFRFVI